MFSKKKTECRVCGYRFTPERENIYTAEEPRSMADMLTKAPTRFSAVDCPFCEAIALQRFIEEHHSKPAGFGMALSAALVSYAVVNGRKCGRTTDYMKDGKGYPLNYCPSCGKRVQNE